MLLIFHIPEGYYTEAYRAGLPKIQTAETLKETVTKAATEVLSFRPPGGPPEENDRIASLASQRNAKQCGVSCSQAHAQPAPQHEPLDNILSVLDIEEYTVPKPWQGVGRYKKFCEREGCYFKTQMSNDPLAIAGITMEMELHLTGYAP